MPLLPRLNSALVLAACAAWAPATPAAPAAASANAPSAATAARFERLVHDYYEHYLATHPEEATQLGDHRYDARVRDVSFTGIAADRALYMKTLAALQAIPASSLPPDDAVDRDIFENGLRSGLFDIDELKTWQWEATDYSPIEGVYLLVARDYAPLPQRLAAAKSRLEAVPRIVQAAERNLGRPPRVYTETEIAQNKGAIGFVQEDLERFVEKAPSMRAALAPARASALAALRSYGQWLEHDLLPRSDGDFRLGRRHFDQRLHFSLDSDLGAPEILARAEREVATLQKQMEETALPLYRRYFPDKSPDGLDGHALVRAVLDHIALAHPDNDTIVPKAQDDLAQATAFVREHKLVTIPDQPVKVIVMPEFQRGAAVAFCDWAGPLEKHGETFYALSPTPADWTPARVATQFREYNDAMLKDITVHEAMPGHYLQGAVAREIPYRTLVRATIGSGTFVEGWAVYAEQFMADAGFGGPEVKMEQLKVRLRVAINAILDQKIHAADMSEADAMHLMMDAGYQEEGEAAGKWRRAEMSAGQLSTYFVGIQEMNALARDMAAKTNGDLRVARDRMLSHGGIATKYVRRLEGLAPVDQLPTN